MVAGWTDRAFSNFISSKVKNDEIIAELKPVDEQQSTTIVKMPLNDTFLKPEPDKFNRKLREAVAKYDSEIVNTNTKKENEPIKANESVDDLAALPGEKVVVERDGQFLFVDSDEYTAKEKEKQLKQQIRQPPTGTNVYTLGAKKPTTSKINLDLNNSREIKSSDLLKRGRETNKR